MSLELNFDIINPAYSIHTEMHKDWKENDCSLGYAAIVHLSMLRELVVVR